MSRAVLSLGSNLGDRERTIADALDDLDAANGVEVTQVSSLVETPALKLHGVDHDAPAYLNAIALIETTLAPAQLLAATSSIENGHGRVREERWGDRTLDIDIVTFDDLVQDDPQLTLPHPRAALREFVLVPWLEVDPQASLPGVGSIAALPAAAIPVARFSSSESRRGLRP
jgi:2-amino-4-hydroxy-6-hydroxymethyldihydropteridine diphosphokinase